MDGYADVNDFEQAGVSCSIHGGGCDGFGTEHNDRILADLEEFLQDYSNSSAPSQRTTSVDTQETADDFAQLGRVTSQTSAVEDNNLFGIPADTSAQHTPSPPVTGSLRDNDHADSSTPCLIRRVLTMPDATGLARARLGAHHDMIKSTIEVIDQRLETLAYFLAGEDDWTSTKRDLWQKAGLQTAGIQTKIESRTGQFNRRDLAYIASAKSFESRLLCVLHVGLVKQEIMSGKLDFSQAQNVVDLNGSCVLEARSWQLEILQTWQLKIEESIRAMGGLVL